MRFQSTLNSEEYTCLKSVSVAYNAALFRTLGRCERLKWLSIWHLVKNFSEISIKIHIFLFKKMQLKCRMKNGGNFVSASMFNIRVILLFPER